MHKIRLDRPESREYLRAVRHPINKTIASRRRSIAKPFCIFTFLRRGERAHRLTKWRDDLLCRF